MMQQNLSKQKYSDSRNPLSYALKDFFDMVESAFEQDGYSRREARAEAYYAVSLRFNISKERARAIMYSVRDCGREGHQSMDNSYLDNAELMQLLKMANDEYDRQRKTRRNP